MRAHAAALAAVLAVATLAPAADAAPKKKKPAPPPACNLVKDATGDASNSFQGAAVLPADQGLDLVGGDVVADAKNITAVIRLAAEPGDATWYMKRYIMQMNVAGLANPLVLAVGIAPTGTTYSFGYYGTTSTGTTGYSYSGTAAVGKIEGKVLTVGTTLANIATMEKLGVVKPGAKVSGFTLTANRRIPAAGPGSVYVADEATGKTPYVVGGRSCIANFTG